MEMGWCEQYEIVMYFNEGGRTAFFCPLGGCLAERFLACPAAKKLPRMPAVKLGEQPHRAEVHEKGSKKSSGPSLEKHGGRCAQWRTRLASLCRDALSALGERMGISRQWRYAL